MKKLLLITAVGFGILLASCSKTKDPDPIVDETGVVTIDADITANRTLTADKIYLLKNKVYVTNNAVLTIQPGTIIKGDKASQASLIITRGAKIEAVGTVDKPIVFTSSAAAGGRAAGDWGGLVLLGRAPNNIGPDATIEGISDATEKAKHGGTVATDNSGTLKYVRIEYAGIALGPDNELNSLTMGSVGSGTTIDYVEVYRAGDDAFEWFGGSVNAKHLISIATWDDDFDTDNGFSGKIQFAVAQRLASTADVSGSNGFESDNNPNGTTATPQTSATFANVTILGPRENAPGSPGLPAINANYQHAAQIRRNSAMSLGNSVLVGYTEGVFYDDERPGITNPDRSSENYIKGSSVFTSNIVAGSNSKANQIKATSTAILANLTTALGINNTFSPDVYAPAIYTDAYKFSSDLAGGARTGVPNFAQVAASTALTGAVWTNAKFSDAFFDKVAYRGAFGTTDWTSGWVVYNPQTLAYTTPGAVK